MATLSRPVERSHALSNALWLWLAAGLLACLLFPPLRGRDTLLGWLPFWLVAAPLIDLMLLHRTRIRAAMREFLRSSLIARVKKRASLGARFEERGHYRVKSCARRPGARQSLIPSRLRSMRRRNSSMMRRYKSSPR